VSSLGGPRVHLREIDSTNERARMLALAGAPHGTLVTADTQTAGRGRQGRRWSAPANSSLLMSLVLRAPPSLLTLIAAVAVCDVVGSEARIKWPNDVVLPGSDPAQPLAKLAGILAEGQPQAGWAVLGIGLNVAVRLEELPGELRSSAATLGYSPREIEPTLERLLAALERRLAEPATVTLEAWRLRDALHGREIAWGTRGPESWAGRGRAEGINDMGHLIVSLTDGGGQAILDAGEVHLERVG
jgi:BirA family biotin operon repressor/biotin-[acetyl-CoA-carboxylase] ligase